MKNMCWLRLTGWILTLVMILTVFPMAAFAESGGTETAESDKLGSPALLKRPEEVDVSSNAVFTYTNAGGKTTDPDKMDPNEGNQMKLKVSDLNDHIEIIKDTVMAVTLPEKIMVTTDLQGFSSDAVSATLEGNKLLLSWKDEKQDSFEATVAVLPHLSTNNDLSGNYVLGTGGNQYYKVMLGTDAFNDSKNSKRKRLSGTAFDEVDGKVYILSENSASVWNLKHISENYYTVRSNENGKYLKIDDTNNGLILEEATEITAQKLLLESVGNGYYSFKYKNKSINNSSFNATNGFASYNYETGANAILKLYFPSDVIMQPRVDLSGTWMITNATRKNAMTAKKHSTNGRLEAVKYIAEEDSQISEEDEATFTFENIIRDWYTVKTESGYLNITKEGAFISGNPQHLVVRTDKNYSSIILSDNERYDVGYTLTNINGKTSDGYGVLVKHAYNDNTRLTLIPAELNGKAGAILTFDVNGGNGDETPERYAGDPGERIILPGLNATKNGQEFIGWAEVNNIYTRVAADINHTYREVYKPGTSYTMKAGNNTLYAVYNTTDRRVTFGIRVDGDIQDEPRDNATGAYKGHFTVEGILKEGRWVIDIDPTKPVNGYYVQNNVTAAIKWVPSSEEIAAALKKEGNIDFDPETQYIHYYVLKYTTKNGGQWQIDGVIRNKADVEITYDVNVPTGIDKTKVSNRPGSYQVAPGTDILIGANQGSTEIKRPSLNGYYFMGWNTEKDGSGTYYNENSTVHLTKNLHLYAQWISEADEPLEIRITSDWPTGKIGYVGARIKLTATLTGFEGKKYALQWQYSTDLENWVDVPDAHDITYTYTLDETTTHYTWRVVAQDIH